MTDRPRIDVAFDGPFAEKLAPIAGRSKLYLAAVAHLREAQGVGTDATAARFADKLAAAEPMLAELAGRAHLTAAALEFLHRVGADLRGGVREGAKEWLPSGHARGAPSHFSSAGGFASPGGDARGRSHLEGAVHGHVTPAPPARPTLDPISVASALRTRQSMAVSVLDSFKVRTGEAIGDLAFSELPALIGANTREAVVLRQVYRRFANAPGNALVRDLMKARDLELMIQKAAEAQDDA